MIIEVAYVLGEKVHVDGDLPAMITRIEFAHSMTAASYEVTWYDDRVPHQQWVTEWRLKKAP